MKINEKNLSEYSTTASDVVKEGYLMKRGEVSEKEKLKLEVEDSGSNFRLGQKFQRVICN